MARLPKHVKAVDTPAGRRYQARINVTGDDGRRVQLRQHFKTAAEASEWHAKTLAALNAGTYVRRSNCTVEKAITDWLEAKRRRIKPTTYAAYAAALQPVIDKYGTRLVQSITRHDVEALIAELQDGTGLRKPWKRTSINPMLARWKTVWAGLVADGTLPRNVVALVEPLRRPAGEVAMKIDDSLSEVEVETLLAAHAGHPREAFLHMALLGLRRGEIGGLRWSAVDLDSEAPTITIRATRVSTPRGTLEQDSTKTATSARVLPIPNYLVPILRRTQLEQRAMRLAAGNCWEGQPDQHVVALELGRPPSPRTLDAHWHACLKRAGLQPRRLHASRHTAATMLNTRGAGPSTIAAWLGHRDGGQLALSVYVKARNAALVEAARLLG